MANLTISTQGPPPNCPDSGGLPAIVGDSLILSLDPLKFSSLPANPIVGQIISITPNPAVPNCPATTVLAGNDYVLLVADADLPFVGGLRVNDLDLCDLLADPICADCCTDLETRVTALEALTFDPPITYFLSIIGAGTIPNLGAVAPKERDTAIQRNGAGDAEYWSFASGVWTLNYTIVTHQNTLIDASDYV